MSISAQRKFLKKRMVIALAAIDPFGLQKFKGYTAGTNFNIESFSVQNTQNFRISISYQFSKVVVKSNLNDKDKKGALDKLKK
jgi:hypothetical protein